MAFRACCAHHASVGAYVIIEYADDTVATTHLKVGAEKLAEVEQLQRVRGIRLSERKFYQKITDIYATSVDYDVTAQATKRFFATV